MRRLLTLLLLLAVFLAGAPSAAGQGATKPKVGERSWVTGAVWTELEGADLHLVFLAWGADPAWGQVIGRAGPKQWFLGRVTCYLQQGGWAVFGGPIAGGTYAEKYFLIEVEDNGQGAKAAGRDRVRLQFVDSVPVCALADAASLPAVERGGLSIHRLPALKAQPPAAEGPEPLPDRPKKPGMPLPGPGAIPDAPPRRPVLPLP